MSEVVTVLTVVPVVLVVTPVAVAGLFALCLR
jgi:hypothetical protein